MINKVDISNNIINNYKDNIKVLNELKIRIKSGSCSLYDIALYEQLVKANKNDKVMLLKMNINA